MMNAQSLTNNLWNMIRPYLVWSVVTAMFSVSYFKLMANWRWTLNSVCNRYSASLKNKIVGNGRDLSSVQTALLESVASLWSGRRITLMWRFENNNWMSHGTVRMFRTVFFVFDLLHTFRTLFEFVDSYLHVIFCSLDIRIARRFNTVVATIKFWHTVFLV